MNLVDRAAKLKSFLTPRVNLPWLNRVFVFPQCHSTQDEAFRLAEGQPGLLVTAINQLSGRGRHGRTWIQPPGLGLAATFVLDAAKHDAPSLSIRAGVAVCLACEALTEPRVPDDYPPYFRLKWPNDVVVPLEAHTKLGLCRKLAGILIERREGLLLLGIGINILQQESDWPANLRDSAVSLHHIDPSAHPPSLEGVCDQLIRALDHYLFADRREIRKQFSARDTLTGTQQTFEHNTKRYTGTVESIDPEDVIILRTADGAEHKLPALTTSLVKD